VDKIFTMLGSDVQKLLESNYERFHMNKTVFEAARFELFFASIGGLFDQDRSRCFEYRAYFPGASHQWHEYAASFRTGEVVCAELPDSDSGDIDVRSHQVGYRRKIFISERGYCGLVPDSAKTGDVLCILFGCDVPVLLRELGTNKFNLIGESYIGRLMDGEAIEALEQHEVVSVKFELV
jgi:hypothetical protein